MNMSTFTDSTGKNMKCILPFPFIYFLYFVLPFYLEKYETLTNHSTVKIDQPLIPMDLTVEKGYAQCCYNLDIYVHEFLVSIRKKKTDGLYLHISP